MSLETSEVLRDRDRNYIGLNGREVYYRIPVRQSGKRKGQMGCGPEGWTCCLCAKSELDCPCDAPALKGKGGHA